MFFNNGGYRYGSLGIGLGFPISNRLFLPNGEDNPAYDNADFYPSSSNGNSSNFILMNSKSSDLGEDPAGGHYDGWGVNQNNRAIATTIINAFPRRMMQNLLLVPGRDNIPIPIAGSYFTKLMDHTPGTLEPWSALITDGTGYIDEIRCHTLTVDGGSAQSAWSNTATTTANDIAGIPAGTTLTNSTALQILEAILYAYQSVSITNFSIANINSNYEIGEIVGNGNRQVTLVASNTANIVANGVTISYSTSYGGGSGNLLAGVQYSSFPRTAAIPSLSSSVVNSSVTFTATIDQTTGADATSSDTTRWWSRLYYGKSGSQNTNSFTGNNLAFGGNVLITSTSMPDTTLNFTDGAGYAYIFVHNNYTLDYFAIGATVQNSFTLISTSSITNSYGATASYKVYRSNSPLNGSFNLTVGDH
jgi:hypothetical protein